MTETAKTITFAVVAAVLGVGSLFLTRPSASQQTSDVGEEFFPELRDNVTAIAALEVVKFDDATGDRKEFKVAQAGGVWVIPLKQNYPADAEQQMKTAASALVGLTKLQLVSGEVSEHGQFGVKDPSAAERGDTGVGTLVKFSDKEGRALAALIIGERVKDQFDQHYVRIPGQDRVYITKYNAGQLTANFTDWVQRDLLGMQGFDITRIVLDSYRVDEAKGELQQGEKVELLSDSASTEQPWKITGLKEDEQVAAAKANAMKSAIDELKIVDVERKPPLLVQNLREGREFYSADLRNPANQQLLASLQRRGFFAMPQEILGQLQIRMVSNEGEVVVGLKDGVEYVLRFGEITGKTTSLDDKKDAKAGDEKKAGSDRYIYVVARVNEDLIGRPVLQPLPELPKPEAPKPDAPKPEAPKPDAPKPDAPKPDAPKPDAPKSGCEGEAPPKPVGPAVPATEPAKAPDAPKPDAPKADAPKPDAPKADAPKADTPKPDAPKPDVPRPDAPKVDPVKPEPPKVDPAAQIKMMRDLIQAENDRKQKEYNDKLAAARKKVLELNRRFAEWYYIIPDSEFQKIRLTRKDLVEPNKAFINKRDGEKFLAENKAKEGVKTTASGLQYKVISEGTGAAPKATDEVEVKYKGTLIDGTVFDQSAEGKTASFGVDGVIKGWQEGLQLMKEGGKYQFFIPSDIGYGKNGSGEKIGPNAVLIFEVELVKVKPAQ